jgi:hypothetical protein
MQGATVDQKNNASFIRATRLCGVALYCFLREDFMKKFVSLIVALCLLCLAAPAWAVPAAPMMDQDVNGLNLSISWNEVPGATGYTLYYAPYPYAGPDTIDSSPMGTVTSYSINLWDGAAYFIAVTASNLSGESLYSNVEYFVMTPSAPDAPVLTAVTDGLSISLSWTEIPDATGYKLHYASDSDPDTFNSLDMGDKTEESYYLWEGAAYYLKVTGYSASGLESEPSNTEYFVMGPPTTSPKFTAADFNDQTHYLLTDRDVVWETATIDFASDGTFLGADGLVNPLGTEVFNFEWEIDAQGRLYIIGEAYYTLAARKDGFLETCWGTTPVEADACDSPEIWYTDFAAANAKVSVPPSAQ